MIFLKLTVSLLRHKKNCFGYPQWFPEHHGEMPMTGRLNGLRLGSFGLRLDCQSSEINVGWWPEQSWSPVIPISRASKKASKASALTASATDTAIADDGTTLTASYTTRFGAPTKSKLTHVMILQFKWSKYAGIW
jgi:hypothetical protein